MTRPGSLRKYPSDGPHFPPVADRTGGLAPGAPAYVHIGVLLLGTLLAAHERVLGAAAPWLLALAALAALTSRSRRTPRAADVALLATELLLVGAAVTFTGGGRSPLLPFLLAPMFSAGYR